MANASILNGEYGNKIFSFVILINLQLFLKIIYDF